FSQNVTEIVYVSGVLWQMNTVGAWYYWPVGGVTSSPGYWPSGANPIPAPTPTPTPTPTPAPVLIDHVTTCIQSGSGTTNITLPKPNPSLSGNTIIVGIQYNSAGSISKINTDKNDTFVLKKSVTNSAIGQTLSIYEAVGVT